MEEKSCVCACHKGTSKYNAQNVDEFPAVPSREPLTDSIIQAFSYLGCRKDQQSLTTTIDWDTSGDCLLACCRDSTVTLHSLSRNTTRHLYSRKYGAYGGRFVQGAQTHCVIATKPPGPSVLAPSATSVLDSLRWVEWSSVARATQEATTHSSAKTEYIPSALRHWDLQENRFVKTLHLPAAVALVGDGLSVSQPPSELILAACVDGGVRILTLENDYPLTAIQSAVSCPVGTLHPTLPFAAIQILPLTVQLFDFRKGWKDSDYFSIDLEAVISREQILCSKNGSVSIQTNLRLTGLLLAGSFPSLFVTLTDTEARSTILRFDVFNGHLTQVFRDSEDTAGGNRCVVLRNLERWKCFEETQLQQQQPPSLDFLPDVSSDGRYLACGGGPDASIKIWSLLKSSRKPLKILSTEPRIARRLRWNPSQMLLASAFDHLAFWGPDESDIAEEPFA